MVTTEDKLLARDILVSLLRKRSKGPLLQERVLWPSQRAQMIDVIATRLAKARERRERAG